MAPAAHPVPPHRARLKIIEGFGKDEIHAFLLGAVAAQTRLVTDDWPSYRALRRAEHKAITVGPMALHAASGAGEVEHELVEMPSPRRSALTPEQPSSLPVLICRAA